LIELLKTGSLEQLLNFGRGKAAAGALLGVGIAGDRTAITAVWIASIRGSTLSNVSIIVWCRAS